MTVTYMYYKDVYVVPVQVKHISYIFAKNSEMNFCLQFFLIFLVYYIVNTGIVVNISLGELFGSLRMLSIFTSLIVEIKWNSPKLGSHSAVSLDPISKARRIDRKSKRYLGGDGSHKVPTLYHGPHRKQP